ncbi:MAG: Flp family type IVb pilin [Bdellovibrionaceae bacterium]|jgi:pilus assembly protein Flp/PilA|nr:Flp family type IVb pilin [Pseudobdellovibrionaceae bacterium]
MKPFNQKGQGLIEYIIIVALVAVAAIGSIKILQKTINVTFANSINSLQGKDSKKVDHEQLEKKHYRKKDLSDFFKGASNGKNNVSQ